MVTARQDSDELDALEAERARIAEVLVSQAQDSLEGPAGLLGEAMAYVLSSPGKLLRPLLMLEACRAGGGDPAAAFPAALGTEYGHVASLVHDDIIDGDSERHGKPALHERYDVPTGILAGDLLIFQTFLMFTHCAASGVDSDRVVTAIQVLSKTCIEMCQGQALEAAISGDLTTSEQTYLDMIRLKTASFCRAAAFIGAHLGGADQDATDALGAYGDYLGMSFQIVDDLLSYVGNTRIVGKSLRSDMDNRRVTLPVIYALEAGRMPVRQQIVEMFAAEPALHTHRQLAGLLAATRALNRARATAYRYTQKAKDQLDRLPFSPSRERLRSLADVCLQRDH